MLRRFGQIVGRHRLKMRFLTVFLLALLVTVALAARTRPGRRNRKPRGEQKLVLVHTIFRHGHRTPVDTYPTDPYVDDEFAPFMRGQLTNKGRLFLYETGEWLRKRYDQFLGPLYTVDSTWAQSTDSDRTRMSNALVLAGLWPPQGTELEWKKGYNWQPVPIHVQPLDEDTLLLARKNCPRYYEELANVFDSDEIKQILDDNQDLFHELSEATGKDIKNLDDVQDVYSTLKAEEEYGKEIPGWMKAFYPERLEGLTAQSFEVNVHNDELKKLKGGPLLKKLIEDWKAKAAGTLKPEARKIFVYTGHDSTIANLLSALNVWDTQIPHYGILTLFELFQDSNSHEFSVDIYLRNTTSVEINHLTIPGCASPCPLNKLVRLTKNVVPTDWEQECQAHDPNYVAPKPGGP